MTEEETIEVPPEDSRECRGGADGDEQPEAATTTTAVVTSSSSTSSTAALHHQDPAILAVSMEVRFRYERDEMMKLRHGPLSQKRPDVLDAFPNIAYVERKKGGAGGGLDNGGSNGDGLGGGKNALGEFGEHRKRNSGDPRERLRKENDGGIVLSPQRRSFNAGCFVAVRSSSTRLGIGGRPHSPTGKNDAGSSGGSRDGGGGGLGGVGGGNSGGGPNSGASSGGPSNNTRRIGSGRILRDAWDFTEKPLDLDEGGGGGQEYNFRPQNHHHNQQQHHGNHHEKNVRTFGSGRTVGGGEYEGGGGMKEKDRRTRYNERRGGRNSHDCRDEEPEWFSEGPTSQNDTIELRGFDDHEKPSAIHPHSHHHQQPKNKKSVTEKRGGGVGDWFNNNSNSYTVPGNRKKNDSQQNQGGDAEKGGGDAAGHEQERKGKEEGAAGGDRLNSDDKRVAGGEQAGGGGDNNGAPTTKTNEGHAFNFEDMFKADSIPGLPGLLTNGVGNDGETSNMGGGKSRFTKWFSRPTTNSGGASSASAQPPHTSDDVANLISSFLLKDEANAVGLPRVAIPPDNSDSYFAPISPAAASGGANSSSNAKATNHIMDMLQIGAHNKGGGANNDFLNKTQMSGRIMNLDELESKIRRAGGDAGGATTTATSTGATASNVHNKMASQRTDEDVTAFNKFMAHISVNHSNPGHNSKGHQPPMSLMEMLSHSQQQDEAQARIAHLLSGPPGGATSAAHLSQLQQSHSLNSARIQQQQQKQQQQIEMLSKLMNVGLQVHRASPLVPEMGPQQSRELLNRPEAQAILQGLKMGDITAQHLYQQLANPALQPRHRGMLMAILKQSTQNESVTPVGGVVNSPRVLSPVVTGAGPPPPQSILQQQQQQLRVSPLTPNAFCVSPIMATSPNTLTVPAAMHQRIPSPRELQVHTQNILQRALIKKKLEEQQENYRKKQEMQQQQQQGGRGSSPSANNNNVALGNNNNNAQQQTSGQQMSAQQLSGQQMSGQQMSAQQQMAGQHKNVVTSPTPLTFTPTAVLRKMTADKEDIYHSKLLGDGAATSGPNKGRAVTGMRQQGQQSTASSSLGQQQQQLNQQQQWSHQYQQMNVKHAGRPIVKANNYPQQQQQSSQQQQHEYFTQQQQQKFLIQQQQQLLRKQQQQQQFHAAPGGHHQQQQFSQQLRAQHQQHGNRTGAGAAATSAGNTGGAGNAQQPSSQQQQSQQQQQFGSWQQFLNPQGGGRPVGRNGGGASGTGGDGGDLSPTTNQLTRWFSPDLLERARGGELPSTANLSQSLMSLEEIERLTAPPVHN